MNEISDVDKAKLQDMIQKFQYFLEKYEGYCIISKTTYFYKDNKLQSFSGLLFEKIPVIK